jgi:hypothetical protein
MGRAKEIEVKVIPSKIANEFVKKHHYSGKVVQNSQLHFGAFLDGKLHGVMSFGPSMDKSHVIGLVKGTGWNEFIELNRMAFDDYLPKNSESRCIAIAIKLIKKNAPQIKWIISFADGTQCGDGTIYRASGFVLTDIKKNKTILENGEGDVKADICFNINPRLKEKKKEYKPKKGFQLRYIYFVDKACRDKLTVPILPFDKIDEIGAGMYKGEIISQAERHAK